MFCLICYLMNLIADSSRLFFMCNIFYSNYCRFNCSTCVFYCREPKSRGSGRSIRFDPLALLLDASLEGDYEMVSLLLTFYLFLFIIYIVLKSSVNIY